MIIGGGNHRHHRVRAKSRTSRQRAPGEGCCTRAQASSGSRSTEARVSNVSQRFGKGSEANSWSTAGEYRLISTVAPHVNKVRYTPGSVPPEENKPVQGKVAFIAEAAGKQDVALRVG